MMRTRSMVGLPAAKASLLLRNRLLPSPRLNLKLRNVQPSAGPPCRRACIHSTLHPVMGARNPSRTHCQGSAGMLSGASSISSASNMPLLCRLSKVMAHWMPPSGVGPSSREQRKSSSRSEARPKMEHERAQSRMISFPPCVARCSRWHCARTVKAATHARCGAARLTRSTSAWKGRPRWPCANLSPRSRAARTPLSCGRSARRFGFRRRGRLAHLPVRWACPIPPAFLHAGCGLRSSS
ncbi:hypothetical protein T492DRAFT_933575 [Pavlovales sp. CCMP2436]|nr:hypothetical protein T492DRAFT_933575 [Pavlovales sp. CCMP2436]